MATHRVRVLPRQSSTPPLPHTPRGTLQEPSRCAPCQVAPDAWAYSTAIDALGSSGEWQQALDLLTELEACRLVPESHCYGAAMRACARAGEWDAVLRLHERMSAAGVPPTAHTLAPALDACGKADPHQGWQRALALLDAADAAAATPTAATPDAATPAAATPAAPTCDGAASTIGVATTAAAAASDRSRRARATITHRQREVLNLHCYAAAARTFARGGKWEASLDLLSRMRAAGVAPNAHVVTAVLDALRPAQQWEAALRVLDAMRRERGALDGHALNAALRVLSASGRADEAAALLREMAPVYGVQPTAVHATTVLSSLLSARKLEVAEALLNELLLGESAPAGGESAPAVPARTGKRQQLQHQAGLGQQQRRQRHEGRAMRRLRADRWLVDVGLSVAARTGSAHLALTLLAALEQCAREENSGGRGGAEEEETAAAAAAAMLTPRMRRCAIVALSRGGRWREAQALLPSGHVACQGQRAQEDGPAQEVEKEKAGETLPTLSVAMEGGGAGSAGLHNAVLHAMVKAKQWQQAEALMDSMRVHGPSPDETTEIFVTMVAAGRLREERE